MHSPQTNPIELCPFKDGSYGRAMTGDLAQIDSRNLPYQETTAVIGYLGVQKLQQ